MSDGSDSGDYLIKTHVVWCDLCKQSWVMVGNRVKVKVEEASSRSVLVGAVLVALWFFNSCAIDSWKIAFTTGV